MKKSFKKILPVIVYIVFGSLAIFSATMILFNVYQANKSEKTYDSLQSLVPESPGKITEFSKDPLLPKDVYKDVLMQNSDFVGWIKIDGTKIDYPVVQSETRDYYLRRGFDKKYSYYGVPYAAEHCDVSVSDNVVIYGHNIKNGSMFSDLEKYTSPDYYQTHKYITFNTLESFGTYEIIAVFKTVVFSEDEFEYFRFESGTAEQFDEFVSTCKDLSLYNIETTAQYGDKLLTLSTCEYSNKHGRLAVVAKRVDI